MVRSSPCHVEIAHFKGNHHYRARLSRLPNEHYEHALQSWSDTQVKAHISSAFRFFRPVLSSDWGFGAADLFLATFAHELETVAGS